MAQLEFLAALGEEQLYERKLLDVDTFYTVVDYPEFGTKPCLYFIGFASEQEIGERISPAFAARLRENFHELLKKAMRYAMQEKLICEYMNRRRLPDLTFSKLPGMTYLNVLGDEVAASSMEPLFTFEAIMVYKDKPGFYLEFDAGDDPDSDPENFEYKELYQYIGFDENLELTGDNFTESIDR